MSGKREMSPPHINQKSTTVKFFMKLYLEPVCVSQVSSGFVKNATCTRAPTSMHIHKHLDR